MIGTSKTQHDKPITLEGNVRYRNRATPTSSIRTQRGIDLQKLEMICMQQFGFQELTVVIASSDRSIDIASRDRPEDTSRIAIALNRPPRYVHRSGNRIAEVRIIVTNGVNWNHKTYRDDGYVEYST